MAFLPLIFSFFSIIKITTDESQRKWPPLGTDQIRNAFENCATLEKRDV